MADAELRVICGPTAAGKSTLALRLAHRYPLVIVSADSRQIYRRFDIGTAKPTVEQRRAIPHECIDLAEPTERFSAARWAAAAEESVVRARSAGREPLLVGGTGFYLRALLTPLFAEPPLDADRRRALATFVNALPTGELQRWCAAIDPARAHLGRAQLIRALEVALLTGRRLSELHREGARRPRFHARYLLVDPGASLAPRIDARIRDMLALGWEQEVRELAATVPPDAPAWNATGYQTIRLLADGVLGLEEAVRRVGIETRRYAKRQRTWFRHQLPSAAVTALDPGDPRAVTIAEDWLKEAA